MEFAILLPVLAALLMGVADAGFLVMNKAVAAQAARAGVRAASLEPGAGDSSPGNRAYPTYPDPTRADLEVVSVVLGATGGCSAQGSMRQVEQTRVYVYEPDPATGQMVSNLPHEGYGLEGSACPSPYNGPEQSCDGVPVAQLAPSYTLDLRDREAPNEKYVGVMVRYEFRPFFIEMAVISFCEYATQRMEPHP